jgi:subtilase family serine protease
MGRVSTEFAKLGALGITIVTGSGDWGTGCAANGHYRSDFPSSSPYIVSTGATTLLPPAYR